MGRVIHLATARDARRPTQAEIARITARDYVDTLRDQIDMQVSLDDIATTMERIMLFARRAEGLPR